MSQGRSFSEFQRFKVLHPGFYTGVLLFVLGWWLLFPADLKTARFYVSRGRFDRAHDIYERLASGHAKPADRLEALAQVAQLRRWTRAALPEYLEAAATVALEGGGETHLLADALVCARALAGADTPEGRRARRDAELFERILAHRERRRNP